MDLSGLTQPLTKLIEVIASGVGAIGRPRVIRKESEAQAEKLITLADAIQRVQHLPLNVEYKDQHLQISLSDDVESRVAEVPAVPLPERAITRLAFQEQKRQENIESIVSEAVDELEDEEAVSSDPLDDDWVTRFFRIAEDISTAKMQTLWGRILAGEVKRPGSFSLRTLDILKNIGQRDANVFAKVAALRIRTNKQESFLINPDNGKYLQDSFDIPFSDLLLLRELDLVVASDMLAMQFTISPDLPSLFQFGSRALVVESSEQVRLSDVTIIGFTTTGHQLAQLVPAHPTDQYIRKVASLLKHDKVSFKSGTIVDQFDGGVKLTGVNPVEGV